MSIRQRIAVAFRLLIASGALFALVGCGHKDAAPLPPPGPPGTAPAAPGGVPIGKGSPATPGVAPTPEMPGYSDKK